MSLSSGQASCIFCSSVYAEGEEHDCPERAETVRRARIADDFDLPSTGARTSPPAAAAPVSRRSPPSRRASGAASPAVVETEPPPQPPEPPRVERVGGTSLAVREAPSLPAIERVKLLLAECVSVDEAKEIRDQAVAVATYYRQRSDALEIQNDAAEIRLRAERRLGELLRPVAKDAQRKRSAAGADHPALSEIGITHKQSSVWQRIAALATEDFEERLAEAKENGLELSTSRVLKGPPPAEMKPREPAKPRVPVSAETDDPEDIARDLIDRLGPLIARDVAEEIQRQLNS